MCNPAPSEPDFAGQEDALVGFTIAAIAEFAAEHHEKFAYFAFDCNPEYGEVLLCLDTAENSITQAARRESYLTQRRTQRHRYEAPESDLQWAVHQLGRVDDLVLPFGNNTGDFSHQGFARMDFSDWTDMADAWLEFEDSEKTRIACYAAIMLANSVDRLVETRAFHCLNRTNPFLCGVGLHDDVQRVLRIVCE